MLLASPVEGPAPSQRHPFYLCSYITQKQHRPQTQEVLTRVSFPSTWSDEAICSCHTHQTMPAIHLLGHATVTRDWLGQEPVFKYIGAHVESIHRYGLRVHCTLRGEKESTAFGERPPPRCWRLNSISQDS